LSHIFHMVRNSLPTACVVIGIIVLNENLILILRSLALKFHHICIELIFCWCSTDASFIYLSRYNATLIAHFLGEFFINCFICITLIIKIVSIISSHIRSILLLLTVNFPSLGIKYLRIWIIFRRVTDLLVVTTGIGSTF
jgi:hypothetical protein